MIRAGLIGALVVAMAIGGAYWLGVRNTKTNARADAIAATQRQLDERGNTNANIDRLDIPDLCRELGGVWNDGTCE